jgi:hypothetical protein
VTVQASLALGSGSVAPAGSAHPTAPQPAAPSATCNIGPGELRRRRRAATATTAALVLALLAIAAGWLPRWTAPYLAPLVGAVVATILQVVMRFCVAFGLGGLVGMGDEPGAVEADPALRAAHRRRAAIMIAAAALAALAWVIVTGSIVLANG